MKPNYVVRQIFTPNCGVEAIVQDNYHIINEIASYCIYSSLGESFLITNTTVAIFKIKWKQNL